MKNSANYQLIELQEVDSTSRYLKDDCVQGKVAGLVFCSALNQTAGYGQQGRNWIGYPDSLKFSIAYAVPEKQMVSGIFSLQIAAMLHQALEELTGVSLFLKWPNDLYSRQGKVAGILIESVVSEYNCTLIIGIGVNRVKQQGVNEHEFAALKDFDEYELFSVLAQGLRDLHFFNQLPKELESYWYRHDYFQMQERVEVLVDEQDGQVKHGSQVKQNDTSFSGRYAGLDEHGFARVIDTNAANQVVCKKLVSGINSIRKILD